jgi:hypothetical protein
LSGSLFGLEPPSQSRLNRKTIFVGTGAEIAAIPLTSPATAFLCTATGSGYIVDELYYTKADGSGRIPAKRAHNHSTSSDANGGDIYDINVANSGTNIGFHRFTKGGLFVASAETTVDATRVDNAIVTNAIVTRLRTTATAADTWTMLEDGGGSISFANRIEWRIKMQVSHAGTDVITWRTGVNMEAITAAGNGTENRFGMEGCSATDGFIHLICSNGGGTRTNTNTSVAATSMTGYKMSYTPGTNIIWQTSGGTIQTVSTNVPSSGSLPSDRTLRYGVRKASSTIQKALYIAMDGLFCKLGDTLVVA